MPIYLLLWQFELIIYSQNTNDSNYICYSSQYDQVGVIQFIGNGVIIFLVAIFVTFKAKINYISITTSSQNLYSSFKYEWTLAICFVLCGLTSWNYLHQSQHHSDSTLIYYQVTLEAMIHYYEYFLRFYLLKL